jgi:uncharacterized protein
LSPTQRQALNEKLESFYRASKVRFVVETVSSLEGLDVVDYTNRAVKSWKVPGDKIGVMFIFPAEHKYFLQVGYGLEGDLTDAYTSGVYRDTIIPAFRQGRYYEGIDSALTQFAKKVDPQWNPPAGAASPAAQPQSRERNATPQLSAGDIIKLIVLLFVIFLIVLPLLRRGGCGGCIGCFPFFPFGGGTTFGGRGWGGGGGGGGGGGWSIGSGWSGGGGSSFGGGGSGGGW